MKLGGAHYPEDRRVKLYHLEKFQVRSENILIVVLFKTEKVWMHEVYIKYY